MKKKLLVAGIFVLVVALILLIFNYNPTEQNIIYGSNYSITQSVSDKEFALEFNPKDYQKLQEGKGTTVNKTFFEANNTKMILEEIGLMNDEYLVIVNAQVSWKLLGGNFLTIRQIVEENGKRAVKSGGAFYCEAFNEKNERVPAQLARGIDDKLQFIFQKEDFQKSEKITIKFKDYYLTDYKFSLF